MGAGRRPSRALVRSAHGARDPVAATRAFGSALPPVDLVEPVMRRVRLVPATTGRARLSWQRWAPQATGVLIAWALWTTPPLRPFEAALAGVAAGTGAGALAETADLFAHAAAAAVVAWPALVAATAGAVAIEALVLARWLRAPAR